MVSQFGVTICINLHNQQVGHKSATCDESIVGAKAHNKQGKTEEHLQKLLWLKAQLREQLRGSAKHNKKLIKSHRPYASMESKNVEKVAPSIFNRVQTIPLQTPSFVTSGGA